VTTILCFCSHVPAPVLVMLNLDHRVLKAERELCSAQTKQTVLKTVCVQLESGCISKCR